MLMKCCLCVRYDLSQGIIGDVDTGYKVGEMNGVVDGLKSCSNTEKDVNAEVIRI